MKKPIWPKSQWAKWLEMIVTRQNLGLLIRPRILLHRHAIEQIFQGMMTINTLND